MRGISGWTRAACVALALAALARPSRAEQSEVRISKGYGILYLPLFVMEERRLLEKHAKAAGLGDIKVTWRTFDGGNIINDAMLSGSLDIASIGVPGFLTLWAKAKGNPRLEILGISGMSATSLYLNTNNPKVKSLKDFTAADKIAVPGIKTSLSAVVLHLSVAKELGEENYASLDALTVGLPHPDALVAVTSGKTGVDSHFASPPFSYMELDHPGVHRVVNSVDVLGHITMVMPYTTRRFHDQNPKLSKAFLDALEEAHEFIRTDKKGTAALYVRAAKVKVSEAELLRILEDPDTRFSTTPDGVMKFANFMSRVRTISAKPASWKDLFFPEVHRLPGS
ncbi:MAG: ABC transporter substrate-binding protein [Myxococcales bacterium]